MTKKEPSMSYCSKTARSSEHRIVKAAGEKQQVAYKVKPIRIARDLSAEALRLRRIWTHVFQTLKQKITISSKVIL
jgi:hypothetical protein